MYKDMKTAAQAAVKLAIATELGLGVVGMSTVHIVEGKPTLGYQAMLALVKRSGRYNYRFLERTDESVVMAWFEDGEKVGESKCDTDDAKRMGLLGKGPWQKYPRQMRTARAASEGVNTFCPDVMGGAVYTPDELGAEVGEDGNIVVLAAEVVAPVEAVEAEVAEPEAAPLIVEREAAAPPAPHNPTPATGEVVRFISKNQQKELAAAAKKAQLTWDGLKHWLASEHQVVVERQADLPESAFHLAVAFCNETSWSEEIANAEVVDS
jgi:hypothetical protein